MKQRKNNEKKEELLHRFHTLLLIDFFTCTEKYRISEFKNRSGVFNTTTIGSGYACHNLQEGTCDRSVL